MHLLAVVHLVYAIISEHVLLCVEIVEVVPLCRCTSHQSYVMLLGERMVEDEIVVPKICERLVVALVAAALLNGRGFPVVLGCIAVVIPELGVNAERALQLEPLSQSHLCRDIAKEVIALSAAAVGCGWANRVAYAAIPKRIALRSGPLATGILNGKDGQCSVCIAHVITALLLAVGRNGYVGCHLQPRLHLGIRVLLEGESAVLDASYNTRLIEHASRHIIVCLVAATRITQRVVLHISGTEQLVYPIGSFAESRRICPFGIGGVARIVHHVVAQRCILACIEQVGSTCGILHGKIGREREVSLAFLSLLGGYHYDTVGTAATVYCRCRSVLQHVQTLYVCHVDGIDAEVGWHSVYYYKRVAVVDRTHTAHLNSNVVARLAGIYNLQSCYLTLNGLSDVGYRRVLYVLGSKRTDSSGEVFLLHNAITYNDNFVEFVDIFGQYDFKRRLATYGNTLVVVADVRNFEYCIVGN